MYLLFFFNAEKGEIEMFIWNKWFISHEFLYRWHALCYDEFIYKMNLEQW